MADNALLQEPASGRAVAADEITTRNGTTVAAELSQRIKTQYAPGGVDGTAQDVDDNGNPLPAGTWIKSGGAWIPAPGDVAYGQDVDVTRSALPTGAATDAAQATAQTRLDLLASEAKLEAVRALLAGTLAVDIQDASLQVNDVGLNPATLAALESITTTHGVTGGGVGRKTVTTAGTRVDLSTTTVAKEVAITALSSNTNLVVVGPGPVVAALATRAGTPLAAGDTAIFRVDDLIDIKLDALVSGEGVSYSYEV